MKVPGANKTNLMTQAMDKGTDKLVDKAVDKLTEKKEPEEEKKAPKKDVVKEVTEKEDRGTRAEVIKPEKDNRDSNDIKGSVQKETSLAPRPKEKTQESGEDSPTADHAIAELTSNEVDTITDSGSKGLDVTDVERIAREAANASIIKNFNPSNFQLDKLQELQRSMVTEVNTQKADLKYIGNRFDWLDQKMFHAQGAKDWGTKGEVTNGLGSDITNAKASWGSSGSDDGGNIIGNIISVLGAAYSMLPEGAQDWIADAGIKTAGFIKDGAEWAADKAKGAWDWFTGDDEETPVEGKVTVPKAPYEIEREKAKAAGEAPKTAFDLEIEKAPTTKEKYRIVQMAMAQTDEQKEFIREKWIKEDKQDEKGRTKYHVSRNKDGSYSIKREYDLDKYDDDDIPDLMRIENQEKMQNASHRADKEAIGIKKEVTEKAAWWNPFSEDKTQDIVTLPEEYKDELKDPYAHTEHDLIAMRNRLLEKAEDIGGIVNRDDLKLLEDSIKARRVLRQSEELAAKEGIDFDKHRVHLTDAIKNGYYEDMLTAIREGRSTDELAKFMMEKHKEVTASDPELLKKQDEKLELELYKHRRDENDRTFKEIYGEEEFEKRKKSNDPIREAALEDIERQRKELHRDAAEATAKGVDIKNGSNQPLTDEEIFKSLEDKPDGYVGGIKAEKKNGITTTETREGNAYREAIATTQAAAEATAKGVKALEDGKTPEEILGAKGNNVFEQRLEKFKTKDPTTTVNTSGNITPNIPAIPTPPTPASSGGGGGFTPSKEVKNDSAKPSNSAAAASSGGAGGEVTTNKLTQEATENSTRGTQSKETITLEPIVNNIDKTAEATPNNLATILNMADRMRTFDNVMRTVANGGKV